MKKYFHLSLLLLLFSPQFSFAQEADSSGLFREMKTMDSLLFELGFNLCDLETVDRITHSGMDFYHDQSGIQDKELFLQACENNLCSTPDYKPIRQLVPGSMEVFPLYDNGVLYGAIQKGVHEFYIREPGKDLYKTSIASFTHLWLRENDKWLLKTILSYDHRQPDGD